jgi:ATP-binding cassette subfamily B protein/subfamily B ATP-binding cassette protein MsbA
VSRWRRLLMLCRPRPTALAAIGLGSLVTVALDLAKPWPLKLVVDSALSHQALPPGTGWVARLPGAGAPAGLLGWLSAGTLVIFVAAWALRAAQAYVQVGAGQCMTAALAGHLFDRVQALPPQHRHSTGDLVKRVTTDSGCMATLLFEVGLPLGTALVSLGAVFAVMWRLDPPLALLAAAAGPVLGLCLRLHARPMEQRSYEQMEAQGRILSAAEQTLTALPIVRAFGREAHEDERFSALCRQGDRAYVRTLLAQLRFKFSAEAVTAAGTAAVIAVGGAHVLGGRLTAGSLFVFIAYLAALYGPLVTLTYLADAIASASAASRRVLELLDEPDALADVPGAMEVAPGTRGAHVHVEAATFAYRPGSPVLEDLSLEVRPGEVVALVGRTGAGKSTLCSLIPRFHDPARGRVLFNGVDVRQLERRSLRAHIAVVHQDPLLLPLTVAENIRYGRPEASDEEVRAAAVAANADGFVRRLAQGYDTPVGERGATLSGGERQRLAIARALLKNAPLLILDEPTASLDGETERLVLEALERLMAGRTALIVAHRLSTVRRADRVVVLERGRIVEEGPHHELYRRGGTYARFCDLQLGGAP